MLMLGMLVVWLVAALVLFLFLRRQEDRRARLRLALQIGAVAGATRAIFVCSGWYVVTHTGSFWIQLPAYYLATLALPEAVWAKSSLLYQGTSSADDFGLYASLGAVLLASSLALSFVVALAVDVVRLGRGLAGEQRD
jgi:hypothetical protein